MKEILIKSGLGLVAGGNVIIISLVICWLIDVDFNDNSFIIGMITGLATLTAVNAYEQETGEEE